MMARRYETQYFTTTADVNPHKADYIFTTDDNKDIRVQWVFIGLNVARVRVKFIVNSVPRANIDTIYFAAGNEGLPLDFTVPAKVHMQVEITDDTGTGRTNVPILIGYDVPDER